MGGPWTTIGRLTPERFWFWSRLVLIGVFAIFLCLILAGIWLSTGLLAIMAVLFAGSIGFLYLAQDEVALLCSLFVGFAAIVRYEAGLQIEEILYGVFYLTYLAYWYASRLFYYKDRFLRTGIDWALFLFVVYATLSLALTPLQQGNMAEAISEWLSISMLAFYFPVKEICIRFRHRNIAKAILISLGVVAVYVAVGNLMEYRVGLSQAARLWEIARNRVVMNEHMLMMGSIISLTVFLYMKNGAFKWLLACLFLLFTLGAMIGQSRVIWVSLALGLLGIFVLVDSSRKLQIVMMGVGVTGFALLTFYLLFPQLFAIIFAGLTDRLFSLQTAATRDISLINRFVEMGSVKEYIYRNPIIGYGFGVSHKYYSLVFDATRVSTYVHNGYVGVLYRHGLIGFILLFYFYFGSLRLAFQTSRSISAKMRDKVLAIAVFSCLLAESLVAHMANPFAVSDTTLLIAVLAGIAGASHHNSASSLAEE